MTKFVNIVDEKEQITFKGDGIVVAKHLADLPGGRVLDLTSWPSALKVVPAGTIIVTDGKGTYKPLAVSESGGAYSYAAAKGAGESYAGILCHTVQVRRPAGSILTMGSVNEGALPFPFNGTVTKAAFVGDCPGITFFSGVTPEKDDAVTAVTLSASTATVAAGSTTALTATVTPADTAVAVVWTSSDTAKATVSDAGVVTGVAAGTAVITADCSGVKATCTVTVQ